jgi:hypothetical protein
MRKKGKRSAHENQANRIFINSYPMGVSKDSDASSIILEEQLLNALLLLANFLHSKTPTKDRNVYLQ